MIRLLAALVSPYMPTLTDKILEQLALPHVGLFFLRVLSARAFACVAMRASGCLLPHQLLQEQMRPTSHLHAPPPTPFATPFIISPQDAALLSDELLAGAKAPHTLVAPGHKLGTPAPLISEIPDEVIEELRQKYGGRQDATAATADGGSGAAASTSGKGGAAAGGKGGKGADGAAAGAKKGGGGGGKKEDENKPVDVSRLDIRVGVINKVREGGCLCGGFLWCCCMWFVRDAGSLVVKTREQPRTSSNSFQPPQAWRHPDADSLYVEEIDVGEEAPRQVRGAAAGEEGRERDTVLSLSAGTWLTELPNQRTNQNQPPTQPQPGRQRPGQAHPGARDAEPPRAGALQPQARRHARRAEPGDGAGGVGRGERQGGPGEGPALVPYPSKRFHHHPLARIIPPPYI
jgi:hypothetical protein